MINRFDKINWYELSLTRKVISLIDVVNFFKFQLKEFLRCSCLIHWHFNITSLCPRYSGNFLFCFVKI